MMMDSNDIEQQGQTLVGISADGSEDWSREFLLDDEVPLAILKSASSDNQSFSDLETNANANTNTNININTNANANVNTNMRMNMKLNANVSVDMNDEDWNVEFAEIDGKPQVLNTVTNEKNTSGVIADNSNDGKDDDLKVKVSMVEKETEEADEDWDMELGIADEVKEAQDYLADGLRLVMNDVISMEQIRGIDDPSLPDPQSSEFLPITIPNRCKVAKNLLNSSGSINLVIFPKPPTLYSLKLDRSRKQYSAVEFDDWLQTIVSKHLSRVFTASQGKDQHWLSQIRMKEKIVTLKLITAWSQYIQILWRNRDLDQLFQSLIQFNQHLYQNLVPDKSQKTYTEETIHELFETLSHLLRIALFLSIERSINQHKATSRYSQNSSKSPSKNKIRINFQFQITLTELSVSPTLSTSQRFKSINTQNCCQIFHDIFQSILKIYPILREKFALFELQCASYFMTMMLEQNFELSWSPKPATLIQFYIKLYQQILTNEKRHKSAKPLLSSSFSSFDGNSSGGGSGNGNGGGGGGGGSTYMDNDSKTWNLNKLEILCDLYLLLNGYIPLIIYPNRHLQNAISELNHSPGDMKGSYDCDDDNDNDNDDEEEDNDEDDRENEGEGEGDSHEDEDMESPGIRGEIESSDLESQSGRTNSQEITNEPNFNWGSTNLSWLQTNPVYERKNQSSSSALDGDDSSVGECLPTHPKRYPTSDSIDSFRLYKEDNISKLTTNRSSISINSNFNDNATITSSSNSPLTSILEEILCDEDISLHVIFHFFYHEIYNFYHLLKGKYPYISRKYLLKSKILFIMILTNLSSSSSHPSSSSSSSSSSHLIPLEERNKGVQLNDLLESFFFECLILLDRQSKESYNSITPSLLTSYGMIILEKYADLFMKNMKYKFSSSCLESILCYHTTMTTTMNMTMRSINMNEIKLLYRRLISISQLSSDSKKSLYYYLKILKIAKKENKLNEFVYMLELISKLLLEFGEYLLAERCLTVMCMLHFGTPLLSIEFELIDVTKLEFTELPQGIELPRVPLASSSTNIISSSTTTSLPTPTGSHLSTGVSWNIRGSTTNPLSPSLLSRSNLPHPSSSTPPASSSSSSSAATAAAISAAAASASQQPCDSQQLSSVLKLIDLFMFTNQYEYATDYCLSLLKRKLFPQGRAQVLTQLATCYLKLRKLDYCEATLDRIAYEADEIVSSLLIKQPGHHHLSEGSQSITSIDLVGSPRKFPTARYHRPSMDGTGKHTSIKNLPPQKDHGRSASDASPPLIVSASALSYVSKIKSYQYLYLRANCRYLANDPEWAIHWLQIALSVCPKGKWDWRGKIRSLIGKSFVKLCLRCRNSCQVVLDPTGSHLHKQAIESSFASSAEEEFLNAITLFKKNSDILKQIKCRNRIIELQISRLFYSITVEGNSIQTACDHKGESILKSAENLCRINLQQVGDTSTPLELIRTLLSCSEISWLQDNHPLSLSSWTEARNLLTITYLQHITTENKQRSNQSTTQSQKSSQQQSQQPQLSQQHPSYRVSDPVNPLGDIPVLAVPYSIGKLTKLYDILTKMIRIGFFIDPSPLNQNGSTLIGAWLRLNNLLQENIRPLFAENQVLQRSLETYTKIFNSSSPSLTTPRSPRSYLADGDSDNSTQRQLVEEIKHIPGRVHRSANSNTSANATATATISPPSPTSLPIDQLKPHLTRPMISSLNRRSRASSKSSNSLNESLGYILKDHGDVPGIIRQLSNRSSHDDHDKPPHKPIQRTGSDVAVSEAVDGAVMEVVAATSNILLPFEMIRKAMSLEAHCDHASREGLKATEMILQHLRLAGKNALFSTYGEDARNILSRSVAPGMTMTLEGYFVPGVLDNSSAEAVAKSMLETKSFGDSPLDLTELLKKNTTKSKHHSNGKLLTFRRQTDRLMSLFIQLKVFSIQYTEGRLSLTDLYKRNNDVLRRIAKSSRGYYEVPRSDLLKTTAPAVPLEDTLVSNPDSNDHDQTLEDDAPKDILTPHATIPHSQSFSDLNPTELPQYSNIYPLSFRYVLLIENFLLLYIPSQAETSVMVLKDKIKTVKLISPNSPHSFSKDALSDCETVSNATHTTNNSVIDGRKHEDSDTILMDPKNTFVNLKYTTKKISKQPDEINVKRKILSRRKSGFNTLHSASSNTLSSVGLPDGKEDILFALSGLDGRQSITEIQPLYFQASDLTVSEALNSLPLPHDETLVDLNELIGEGAEGGDSGATKNEQKEEKQKMKIDYDVSSSLRILGFQNLLFLVNAMMLEESILIVGPPGYEQNIFHICTALLRLLRPLYWQHLYLPFMQSSILPVFKIALKSREPFLIGTFYEVIEGVRELLYSYMKNSQNDHLSSSNGGGYLSDIVIVDAKSGYVKPSRRMRFAATCSLSLMDGVVPEADPTHLKLILEKLEAEKRSGSITFKPPLPARYRYEIFYKLSRLTSGDDIRFLSFIPQIGENGFYLRESKQLKWGSRFQEGVQSVMLSLFKGLIQYIKYDETGHGHNQHRHAGSDFSIVNRGLFNQERFLKGVKDDLKPYLQYLFHTRMFKKFVEDISDYKTFNNTRLKMNERELYVYPSLHQLITISKLLHASRRELYSSLAVERLGGFMTTYFLTIPDPGQPYPFFYTFPYGLEDMTKNKQRKGSIKVKRRWCVLDAQTLTYFKSRSQRLIKDHIRIDPTSVRLVTSPFCQPLLQLANGSGGGGSGGGSNSTVQYSNPTLALDSHRCGLEYGENQVLVFRMDTIEEHTRWVRALRARLIPQDEDNEEK